MKVTIVGLGYVGFPLTQLCVEKTHSVFGIDLDDKKISLIRKGLDPIENKRILSFPVSKNYSDFVPESDIIIVCVPTPVSEEKTPDLKPLKTAVESIAKNLKNNPLIIIESTINPGVMEEVVEPIFRSFNLRVGEDYYLAHCPERIDPGNKTWTVKNIPRVVGAFTKEGLEKAYVFYTSILEAPVKKLSSIKTVEATKIVENTFRDINIAYVNELAKSFDKMNINIMEVIEGASTKPFAFMPHYPGCGVGGHCIPVDPYYLIDRAKKAGFDHKFLLLAREINNSMPKYTVEITQEELNELEKPLKNTTIGLLGLSYKKNVGDLRESPAIKVKQLFEEKGSKVIVYDPFLPSLSDVKSLKELQDKTSYLVLTTDHDEFKELDFGKIDLLIDGRNMFEKTIKIKGRYRGIGVK